MLLICLMAFCMIASIFASGNITVDSGVLSEILRELRALNTAVSSLSTTVPSLHSKMDNLIAFSTSRHNFAVDRISALKLTTRPINVCGFDATGVSISFDNKLVTVTVAHFNCQGERPAGHVPCEGLDISLKFDECPDVDYALDFSKSVALRDGDQVVSFGYHTNALYSSSSWLVGHIFSYVTTNIHENRSCLSHYSECGVGHSTYSHVVNAGQMSGMSGAVVLNGYGIVGLAVASLRPSQSTTSTSADPSVVADDDSSCSSESATSPTEGHCVPVVSLSIPRHRQTLVIDSDSVQKCLNTHLHLFKDISMCPRVQVIAPPILMKF